MGFAGTVLSASIACGSPTQVAAAADCRGDPLSVARRSALADAAAVLPAGLDGQALVLPVAGQQAMAVIEPCPALDRARGGRPRSLAQRRGDRQPERQNHGERRASGL